MVKALHSFNHFYTYGKLQWNMLYKTFITECKKLFVSFYFQNEAERHISGQQLGEEISKVEKS